MKTFSNITSQTDLINVQKHKYCEFCDKKLRRVGDNVCDNCDLKHKSEQESNHNQMVKSWAAKYKCRKCNKGLPLSRRFNCLDCFASAESNHSEYSAWPSEGYLEEGVSFVAPLRHQSKTTSHGRF